jgi:hypothetical protein
MSSVLAETSFGKPTITSIAVSDGITDASSLSSRGGQRLLLTGTNFGPPSMSSKYLDFVKYGKTGVEYDCENARVLTHQTMECTTTEGTGDGLFLTVSVLGQEGASSSSSSFASVSYAPPAITSVSTSRDSTPGASADTIEVGTNFRLLLNATNAGVGLRNGNVLAVLWDDQEMVLIPDDTRTKRAAVISFFQNYL